jgi:hypothetical protein
MRLVPVNSAWLHPHRLAQKSIALAQHLRASVGVVQLVIQIVPRDEFALGAGRGQARGHLLRLPYFSLVTATIHWTPVVARPRPRMNAG